MKTHFQKQMLFLLFLNASKDLIEHTECFVTEKSQFNHEQTFYELTNRTSCSNGNFSEKRSKSLNEFSVKKVSQILLNKKAKKNLKKLVQKTKPQKKCKLNNFSLIKNDIQHKKLISSSIKKMASNQSPNMNFTSELNQKTKIDTISGVSEENIKISTAPCNIDSTVDEEIITRLNKFDSLSSAKFRILFGKISANITNDIHKMMVVFSENFNDITNLNFLMAFQNCCDGQIVEYRRSLLKILELGLEENESMLWFYSFKYNPKRSFWYEEKFLKGIFCTICLFHDLDQVVYQIQDRFWILELSNLMMIFPDQSKLICQIIFEELNYVFMMFKNYQSFKILFANEFIKKHNNIVQLLLNDEIMEKTHQFRRKNHLKYQILHQHIHTFLQNNFETKIKLLSEFQSICFLFYRKSVLEKIKYHNTFVIFYYSIVSLNLFFDSITKNSELKILVQNENIGENRFILYMISFFLRIFYVQPLIACFDLEIDTILRYSYLIKRVLHYEIELATKKFTDEEFHDYLQENLKNVLCFDVYIYVPVFLEFFKNKEIYRNGLIYSCFNKRELGTFEVFTDFFSKRNRNTNKN